MDLICPICGSKLNTFDKSLVCSGHHCFDIARQGYVNLLTVQQKHSLHPGDTREQVLSRRAFLEAGYYAPIAEALIAVAKELMVNSNEIDRPASFWTWAAGKGITPHGSGRALGMRLTGIGHLHGRPSAVPPENTRTACGSAPPRPTFPWPTIHAVCSSSLFALTMAENSSVFCGRRILFSGSGRRKTICLD